MTPKTESERVYDAFRAFESSSDEMKLNLCYCMEIEATRYIFRLVLQELISANEMQEIRKNILRDEYKIDTAKLEDEVWNIQKQNHYDDDDEY